MTGVAVITVFVGERLLPPLLAMREALRLSYGAIMRGEPDPTMGPDGQASELDEMHETIGIGRWLAVERATMGEGGGA